MTDFLKEFKRRYEASCQQLDKIGGVSSSEIESALDEVASQLKQLKLFLSDNAGALTKYDLKRRQGDIKSLEDAIASKSNELLVAKNSFSFTNILNNQQQEQEPSFSFSLPSAPSQVGESKVEDDCSTKGKEEQVVSSSEKPNENCFVSTEDTFTIRNASNLELVFSGEEAKTKLAGKELELSNIRNCHIKVLTHVPTVRVDKAVDCEIICGPVSTSVFIEDAVNCSFVMAAQQFRIHSSRDCRFYIHVTSKAIIEACRDLAFAPYNLEYLGMLEDFWAANLRLNDVQNNWDRVDDFDWPSASAKRPSPNWTVLPEGKRVASWN